MRAALDRLEAKHGAIPGWNDLPEGWFALVDRLITDLKAEGFNVSQIDQIKEKFGGLRFYVGATSERCHELIRVAEDASFSVCQECGAHGRPRGKNWIRTVCDLHAGDM